MDWMDLTELKNIILNIRSKEFNDIKNQEVQKNIHLALKKIEALKAECLKNIKNSEKYIVTNMIYLLKTEAEIINIVGITAYGDFKKGETIESYLEKDEPYIYKEYITDIDYYAIEYQSVSSLAKFYVTFIS